MTVSERFIHDPVPKNVSKFPIHQTYLTEDAEGNSNGIYKFKCPEVWSSARSGKKSIAIRSIKWQSFAIVLGFVIRFSVTTTIPAHDEVPESTQTDNYNFIYTNTIPAHMCVTDVLVDIRMQFEQWANSNSLNGYHLITYLFGSRNRLQIALTDNNNSRVNFRITGSNNSKCSESFNRWLNQPKDYFPAASTELVYYNVWDRTTPLHFHASFVPFDNYQYIGTIFDNWNTPIIYQDPNSSPLFNIWITTNMKTPLNLLYEEFIFRFTFIISSESQYSS